MLYPVRRVYDSKLYIANGIKKHLGNVDQLADANLVSDVPQWTTAHRIQGKAYIYAKLNFDSDVYPNGVPMFSCIVKGKKCFDPRATIIKVAVDEVLDALGIQDPFNRSPIIDNWNGLNEKIDDLKNMKMVLRLKFKCNCNPLERDLLATGDSFIVEDCSKRTGGSGDDISKSSTT